MISIRGAITIKKDEKKEILKETERLLYKIIESNNIKKSEIISIFFSCTSDIKSAYPAEAARNMGLINVSLMCFNEMYVEGSLPLCIRVMMLVDKEKFLQDDVVHIYLEGAKILRPDLYKS